MIKKESWIISKKQSWLSKYFDIILNIGDDTGGILVFFLLAISIALLGFFYSTILNINSILFYLSFVVVFIFTEMSYFEFIKREVSSTYKIDTTYKAFIKFASIITGFHLVAICYILPYYIIKETTKYWKEILNFIYPTGIIIIGTISLFILWFVINIKIANKAEDEYIKYHKKRKKRK